MKTYIAFFCLLFSVGFISCDAPKAQDKPISVADAQKSIVIYGSNNCIHCINFKAKLDSVGLEYTFNDVDVSDQLFQEMYDKVKNAGHTGRISFPVVIVDNNQLFVAPKLDTVLVAIK